MADLMPVSEALARILSETRHLGSERVPLTRALGRVLEADVFSRLDLPPFDASSMDGYAARSIDLTEPGVTLRVVGDVAAGRIFNGVLRAGETVRIMTGAAVPTSADAVIPVEQTDADWGGQPGAPSPSHVTIKRAAKIGDNIRQRGENVLRGQFVLGAGIKLRPQDIGMAASLGLTDLAVSRQPKVVIISSGDELIKPGNPLPPGAIYESNSLMLAALVEQWGGVATVLPSAPDTLEGVRGMFEVALALTPDIVVSSAGVSVGAADYVRSVLAELGEISFWKINIRPGKPLAYGRIQAVPFFGLPGNPVSAMVTAEIVLRPAMYQMTGQSDDAQTVLAITGEDIPSDGRQSYLRVMLSREGGSPIAHLTGTQSSGALFSLVMADGLLIVPEGVTFLPKGSAAEIRLLR